MMDDRIKESICKAFVDPVGLPDNDKKTRDQMLDELEDYYINLLYDMDDESLEFEYNSKLGI